MKITYDMELACLLNLNKYTNRTGKITLYVTTTGKYGDEIIAYTDDTERFANYLFLDGIDRNLVEEQHIINIVKVLKVLDFDIDYGLCETVEEILNTLYSKENIREYEFNKENHMFYYYNNINEELIIRMVTYSDHKMNNYVWLDKDAINKAIEELKKIRTTFDEIQKIERKILCKLWSNE